ncbi:hypothetical protein DQ04_03581000 [Trypanosoma grayi]|uniref:hypothetical protein n=1 Tax=Trypanosoma grayi TaxID=71804 RepID=UPI0004F4306F|nr:hypothetical protein DQ04_03581000 [Trypanosoma grayi]KEG10550.1 hypothetical protein DQ04_03581000 [Trypanosoma grayi]
MACAHFAPNPFKEDICKNCQKSKGLHSGVFRVVYSTPPCPEFKANPFKHDICATCLQPKTVHKVSDRDCRGANWLTTHSELKSKYCDGYKEHAFKQDVCLTCGRKKEDHRSGGHRKVRHVDVFEMSSGCLEEHCEPSKCLLSNSHGPEYSVPEAGSGLLHNKTLQQAISHSFDPNLKGNKEESPREGCPDFREHAFKRNQCINCGRTREFHKDVPRSYTPTHEVGNGDTDGNEGKKLGERNRGGCMKRGPAQATVKVPPKMRDDDASSESETENENVTPQKKVPAQVTVKVPPKMRDDDALSESVSHPKNPLSHWGTMPSPRDGIKGNGGGAVGGAAQGRVF